MTRAAFILAGGLSRRMGRDKALIEYGGEPLAARAARIAAEAAGRAFLVGPAALYGHLGFPCLDERYRGLGPISGLHAALSSGLAQWCLLLACDMPGLDAPSLRGLLETAENAPCEAAVTVSPGGRPEPLCAAYHARLAPLVEQHILEKRLALHDLLASISWTPFPAPHPRFAANINTPEDWAQWNR
jgi:molybdopterin-guanine dinucleotide biosynthesis protein A